MEARRAETPDVALAAPFTTARPPEAGCRKNYGGLTRGSSFVLIYCTGLLPLCHTKEEFVATMRFFWCNPWSKNLR
jgi:hypothetical protein